MYNVTDYRLSTIASGIELNANLLHIILAWRHYNVTLDTKMQMSDKFQNTGKNYLFFVKRNFAITLFHPTPKVNTE